MNILPKTEMIACVVSLMLGLSGCSSVKTQRDVAIVPTPLSMEKGTGSFTFGPNTVITVPTEEQKPVAGLFASLFTRSAGFTPKVQVGTEGDVCLELDKNLPEDAYEMQVSSGQIRVKASDSKGLFYGLQNLRLLLPPAIESSTAQDTVEWTVPEMTVKDAPRFGYRGFMLDVSRYFLPKEELLRMIDCMALLKLNRLHLHLTDDNGWRLEIKKYPKLTEVGAWKVDRQHLPFPERRNPKRGEPATVGGYYTQADMKEIIAYAADRQIEIIPEIDIPAHSNAALASYPEYACPVVKDFIGVIPGLGGKNAEIIFCGGNEKTYEFLQDVLDEVIALFPSRYIHLGGESDQDQLEEMSALSGPYPRGTPGRRGSPAGILYGAHERLCTQQRQGSHGLGRTDQQQTAGRCHHLRLAGIRQCGPESGRTGTPVCHDTGKSGIPHPLPGATVV